MDWIRNSRRRFMQFAATVPGLAPAAASAAHHKPQGRDVVAELGVRKIINAAGTYTALTASLMPPEVLAAIQTAGQHYCPLNELHDAVGQRIAELVKAPAAMVSAGCASALTLSTAACLTGTDKVRIKRVPDLTGMKDQVLIQKTHRVGYDHAVRNCGVELIEVESAADVDAAASERTAMMFFLNSATAKGQISHEEFVALGKKHNVPTLVDAAADVPPVDNLWRFTQLGYDLVAFSGGKGLRGPQSAGLLLGREDLIAAARLNNVPNGDAVCRTNKVNKEELVGMLVALELYLDRDHKADWKEWEKRCRTIAKAVKKVPGMKTEIFVPEFANAVPHLRLTWDYEKTGLTPPQLAERLRGGDPSIEPRPGASQSLDIGVWMMQPGDDETVAQRLKQELS